MRANEAGISSLGMLIVGMIAGAVLMALFNGLPDSVPGNVGSGLKSLVERSESDTDSSEKTPGDAVDNQPGDPVEFDFYKVLPDVGRIMMDDFPAPSAERTKNPKKVIYMIQAASLRKESDAEALRARLALAGYESITQRVNVQDQGTYYRVRIGPYESRRTVKNEINKLRGIGITAMVVPLDAG